MLREEGRGVAMSYPDFTRIVMGGSRARRWCAQQVHLHAVRAHSVERPALLMRARNPANELLGAGPMLRRERMAARDRCPRVRHIAAARDRLFATLDDFTLRVHLPQAALGIVSDAARIRMLSTRWPILVRMLNP